MTNRSRIPTACSRCVPLVWMALMPGACRLWPDGRCLSETRNVEVRAELTAAGAPAITGAAYLGLMEGRRGAGSQTYEQTVIFGVHSTLDRRTVSAVHLHRANDAPDATPLYDIPIRPGGAEANITVVFSAEPYTGTTPFGALFDVMVKGALIVDVHTGDPRRAALTGRATSTFNDWQRPSCS